MIYIPVWLDQKFFRPLGRHEIFSNLHSSMVRLEINNEIFAYRPIFDIYIPVWLDQKSEQHFKNSTGHTYLHSSMVRLEISLYNIIYLVVFLFTFQYGQIRNGYRNTVQQICTSIYIPVWLDQKFLLILLLLLFLLYLHSSMVRLEMWNISSNRRQHNRIYIPVWLDQKLFLFVTFLSLNYDLHSSMVRLEMFTLNKSSPVQLLFTFQYGQIRNLIYT